MPLPRQRWLQVGRFGTGRHGSGHEQLFTHCASVPCQPEHPQYPMPPCPDSAMGARTVWLDQACCLSYRSLPRRGGRADDHNCPDHGPTLPLHADSDVDAGVRVRMCNCAQRPASPAARTDPRVRAPPPGDVQKPGQRFRAAGPGPGLRAVRTFRAPRVCQMPAHCA